MKRIARLGTVCGAKVKLVVTQSGYAIRLTEVFGCRVQVTLLSRAIVNSTSTVDELFDRYLGKIQIDEPDSKIVVHGTSGTHEVTIVETHKNEIVISSTGLDNNIVITFNGETMRVMEAKIDNFDNQYYPVPGTEMLYYDFIDGEIVTVCSHIA